MYGKHSYFDKLDLPWIRLMRIPEYWETYALPKESDYPRTTTAFDYVTDPDDKSAVEAMEAGLDTEDSIITAEMVPVGRRVSAYLGTVDVDGQTGEEVLISPYQLDDDVVSVLAFHYTEKEVEEGEEPTEEKEWKLIDTAVIKDGYVYATLDSFSPIAIFAIKRAPYLANNLTVNGRVMNKTYVANGDITVITQEDGVLYITNSFGVKTKAEGLNTVVAGTVDDSDLNFAKVSILDTTVAFRIYGGSIPTANDKFVKINKVTISANGTKNITFRNVPPGNAVKELEFNLIDSETSYFGSGESIVSGVDLNGDSTEALGYASPCRTENAFFNIINSKVSIVYLGSICGRFFTGKSTLKTIGVNFDGYFAAGGSHGKVGEVVIESEDTFYNQYETTNRGAVGSVRAKFKNCDLPHAYVGGDPRESDVDGLIGKSYINCTGGKLNIGRGTNGGVLLALKDVEEIVEAIKVTPSTEFTYDSEEDKILNVLVRQR